ncbi:MULTISPECIES: DUF6888 family protein [unclassified Microcoleus]|uniref:DUF6888 family protein n=1 Tax=unclassified Microcoleus TaxID=2642155 RepID=UPI0040408DDA
MALQPIPLVCVDERTHNLFVLAGSDEEIEVKIAPNGEFFFSYSSRLDCNVRGIIEPLFP